MGNSARFWSDLTSAISTERLYSFSREVGVSSRSRCLMSILLAASVFNGDFPVTGLFTQWYTEGVCVHV